MTNPDPMEVDPLQRTGFALRRARDARPLTVIGRIGRWFIILCIALPPLLLAAVFVWLAVDLLLEIL